ncbi:MAG TPA: diguanylate cyclase [Lacipirellulaceae bacterium]|nr:diguanylate cyclase [Lacipirellulaceae bacterium]
MESIQMFAPLAVTTTFLLVNLACACVALGVGFTAGVWFLGGRSARPKSSKSSFKKPAPRPAITEEARRVAERTLMATSRVADLAKGVMSDVGDHAAKMKAISAELAGVNREDGAANEAVLTAMDQILAANDNLQQRLEKAEKQLEAQAAEIKAYESEARTDSLTGLSNRRAFDDELKRRINEWDRKQTPLTLIILDIDHFKKFNDTHGHQVGDEVLRTVAKTLRQQARDMDLPCRYGGEEFAVVLPATELAGACIVGERIRRAVEASVTVYVDKTLKVTCSLGVAQVVQNDDSASLIRRADDALYASKKAGRNCGHWGDGQSFYPITATQYLPAPTNAKNGDDAGFENKNGSGSSFIQALKRRVTESHRFGIRLTVIHFKIEEFESVLRNSGKAVARQMLDLAEPALEKVLRPKDLLARMDNGEFVVMLPGNTRGDAVQLVKRLQITMSNFVVPLKDRELHVRFRHGIAELKPKETAQQLLFRARQDVARPEIIRKAVDA